jgi:hypothetical protein
MTIDDVGCTVRCGGSNGSLSLSRRKKETAGKKCERRERELLLLRAPSKTD